MAKYKVLSTKKLDPSLIEQAKEIDIEIVEQEFINVQPIVSEEKKKEVLDILSIPGEKCIVFTSSNAIASFKNYFRTGHMYYVFTGKIFCLSGKTKDVLFPFFSDTRIKATRENASELAKAIIQDGVKEIIFFCGNKRRDELPMILKKGGIKVHEVVVYETIETPTVVTEDIDAVLFFSPSAVQSFFSLNQLKKETVCFAIGETTANSIADFTNNKIIISEFPTQHAMVESVNFYFQNINCYE